MVDSVRSRVRSEFVPLREAAREFEMTEGELIRAGIEGQIRVYFWLNDVRLAQKVKHDKEADTLVRIGEPQRARFYYIPVFRTQLAELVSGRDAEASALTRADDDGAAGEYWSFMWDRDERGQVIPMPQITVDGLFVRRSDLKTPQESTDEREPARADAEPVTAGSPLSRQRHHENEILRVLAELGHDTKALPKWSPTTPGGKQEARAKLPRMTKKVFDKAWERLSSSGDIAYAE